MPNATNSIECFVFIREVPMSSIPSTIGQGPSVPIDLSITTTGAHAFSGLGVPPGVDVTVTLFAAGAGGAGAPVAGGIGGGGGGGGAGVILLIPAATWALGGDITLGSSGLGGAAATNGTNSGISTITMNAGAVSCFPAVCGSSIGGGGGAGGTVISSGTGYTLVTSRPGKRGTNGLASGGAPGGGSAFSQGGQGGAGGIAPTGAGGNGGAGSVTVSFSV